MPDETALAARVRAVAAPVAAEQGVDVEDVSVSRAGRRRRVVVLVDRDGGVTLDQCAEVSERLAAALDGSDVLGEEPYVLEVGSPGVERPLREPRHWRRNTGRLVRVVRTDSAVLTGRVLGADDDGADLDVDGSPRRLSYPDVGTARVQVEMSRRAEAGPSDELDEPDEQQGD